MASRLGAAAAGGVLFFLMASVSLEWANVKPSLLWLATGAVTTIALEVGPRLRWWVIGGGAIGGLVTGPVIFDDEWPELLGPVVGNTAESALIVLALPLALGAGLRIRTTRDGWLVVAILVGAAAAGALFALLGEGSTVIGDPPEAWWRWTLGNSVGELLLVPLVLFRGTVVMTRSNRANVEMALTFSLIAALAVAAVVVDSPLLYLVIPLVLWIAIRFGPVVAAPVATVTVSSIWAVTARGHGPFVEFSDDPALQAQLFTLSVATCVIIGGAHAVRAWNDNRRLAAVLAALPDILFIRSNDDGRLESSWVPFGSERAAAVLDPASIIGSPTIQTGRPERRVESVTVAADDNMVFERRTVPVDDARDLDLFRNVTIERQALRELRLRRDAVDDARWAERERLARALHDSPVQLLAAAILLLEIAKTGSDDAADSLDKARVLTSQAMDELRDKLGELMPPDAAEGDVVAALGLLANQLLHDVDIVLQDDSTIRATPDVGATLFLIGREAVSNVALHAHATRVEISLAARAGDLILSVVDDGVGLPKRQSPQRGYGIGLMQERAAAQGWDFRLEAGSAGGTRVVVTVPGGSS